MNKKLLAARVSKLQQELRGVLSKLDDVSESRVYLPRAMKDQTQLLTLQVWSIRHKVDLTYILRTLLKGKYRWNRKERAGLSMLGIPTPVLCGPSSEKFLLEQISKDFPGNQHKIDARHKLRRELIGVRSVIRAVTLDTDDPDKFVSEYGKLMTARKKTVNEVISTRAWRGNPWR